MWKLTKFMCFGFPLISASLHASPQCTAHTIAISVSILEHCLCLCSGTLTKYSSLWLKKPLNVPVCMENETHYVGMWEGVCFYLLLLRILRVGNRIE